MKPKIFIGSSTENIEIAQAIEEILQHTSEITIWPNVEYVSDYTLNSLLDQLKTVDFAIFVFLPNDTAIIRKKELNVVRDNVIFELGLFMGYLDKKRSFIVQPKNMEFHIPTDLLGINPVMYDSENKNLKNALSPACTQIQTSMKKLGLKSTEKELINQEGIKIHVAIGDESLFDKLNEAHSIDIISNTAKTFIKKYSHKIVKAIASHGCNVRILVSNPESIVWDEKSVCNGLCPGINIQNEIDDVLGILKNKISILEKNKNLKDFGSLEVKEYLNLPTCSIIIIDNQIARFTPYLPFAHSTEVPIYDFNNTEKSEVFPQLQQAFERVWISEYSKTVFSFPDSHKNIIKN